MDDSPNVTQNLEPSGEAASPGRTGLSGWRFGWRDAATCALLVAMGAALWLPGLGRRGLWTSGEARSIQTARRMVKTGDWVCTRLEKRDPLLMVDPASGERGGALTGWKRWPTRLSYESGAVLALEEQWRSAVKAELERNPPSTELRFDYVPQIFKPVFFYWLVAAGYKLGVPMEGPWMATAIRCFSTNPAILLLPVVYVFGCLLYGRLPGVIAAVVLATCREYFWIARVAKMDMTLTFILGVAFLLWYLGRRGVRPLLCSMGVFVALGCASLMKSPVYLLLPGLIAALHILVEEIGERGLAQGLRHWPSKVWRVARQMHVLPGLLVYLAVLLPWNVMVHVETDGQFTREMYLRQNLARAGLIDYGREIRVTAGPLFYFGRLLADLLPWWIMLPGAIVHVFRPRCRAYWRQGAWLLVWMVTWFVLFSCLKFRKDEYILPMYAAVAMLIGKMLADLIRSPAGGHISWRMFADATRVGLAWMIGRRTATRDPDIEVAGDLRMTIAVRMAAVAMAVAAALIWSGALLTISDGVRQFIYTFPDADEAWLGSNDHDRTAIDTAAVFMKAHLGATVALAVAIVAAMVVAAVLVFKRRPAPAVALWTGTMALTMLSIVHVFQDRVLDTFRSQRAFAARLEEVIAETGPDTQVALFGVNDPPLVTLMPERFDAIPRMRFGLLRGYVEARRDKPVLVLLPRKDYQDDVLFGRYAWGSLANLLEEVPTNMPQYDRAHNDALVILRALPRLHPSTRPRTRLGARALPGRTQPTVR